MLKCIHAHICTHHKSTRAFVHAFWQPPIFRQMQQHTAVFRKSTPGSARDPQITAAGLPDTGSHPPQIATGELVEVGVLGVLSLRGAGAGAVQEALLVARADQVLQHKRRNYILQRARQVSMQLSSRYGAACWSRPRRSSVSLKQLGSPGLYSMKSLYTSSNMLLSTCVQRLHAGRHANLRYVRSEKTAGLKPTLARPAANNAPTDHISEQLNIQSNRSEYQTGAVQSTFCTRPCVTHWGVDQRDCTVISAIPCFVRDLHS